MAQITARQPILKMNPETESKYVNYGLSIAIAGFIAAFAIPNVLKHHPLSPHPKSVVAVYYHGGHTEFTTTNAVYCNPSRVSWDDDNGNHIEAYGTIIVTQLK